MLFDLKAQSGLPFDVILERVIKVEKMNVDWVQFIETARKNKWFDFQTMDSISNALLDARISRRRSRIILACMKQYILDNPLF